MSSSGAAGVTLVLSGLPQQDPRFSLNELAKYLEKVFGSDEIGTFRVREVRSKVALDFNTGYDAMLAQQKLDMKTYTLEDGIVQVLRARVTRDAAYTCAEPLPPPAPPSPPVGRSHSSSDEDRETNSLRKTDKKINAELKMLKIKQKMLNMNEKLLLQEREEIKAKLEQEFSDEEIDHGTKKSKKSKKSKKLKKKKKRQKSPSSSSSKSDSDSELSRRSKAKRQRIVSPTSLRGKSPTNISYIKQRSPLPRIRSRERSPVGRQTRQTETGPRTPPMGSPKHSPVQRRRSRDRRDGSPFSRAGSPNRRGRSPYHRDRSSHYRDRSPSRRDRSPSRRSPYMRDRSYARERSRDRDKNYSRPSTSRDFGSSRRRSRSCSRDYRRDRSPSYAYSHRRGPPDGRYNRDRPRPALKAIDYKPNVSEQYKPSKPHDDMRRESILVTKERPKRPIKKEMENENEKIKEAIKIIISDYIERFEELCEIHDATAEVRKKVLSDLFETVYRRLQHTDVRYMSVDELVMHYRRRHSKVEDQGELGPMFLSVLAKQPPVSPGAASNELKKESAELNDLDSILQGIDIATLLADEEREEGEIINFNINLVAAPAPAHNPHLELFTMQDDPFRVHITVDHKRTKRFFIAIKRLLRSIRPEMRKHADHIQIELFMYIGRLILEKRIYKMIEGRAKFFQSSELIAMYREAYPVENDPEFVIETLCDIWRGKYNDDVYEDFIPPRMKKPNKTENAASDKITVKQEPPDDIATRQDNETSINPVENNNKEIKKENVDICIKQENREEPQIKKEITTDNNKQQIKQEINETPQLEKIKTDVQEDSTNCDVTVVKTEPEEIVDLVKKEISDAIVISTDDEDEDWPIVIQDTEDIEIIDGGILDLDNNDDSNQTIKLESGNSNSTPTQTRELKTEVTDVNAKNNSVTNNSVILSASDNVISEVKTELNENMKSVESVQTSEVNFCKNKNVNDRGAIGEVDDRQRHVIDELNDRQRQVIGEVDDRQRQVNGEVNDIQIQVIGEVNDTNDNPIAAANATFENDSIEESVDSISQFLQQTQPA